MSDWIPPASTRYTALPGGRLAHLVSSHARLVGVWLWMEAARHLSLWSQRLLLLVAAAAASHNFPPELWPAEDLGAGSFWQHGWGPAPTWLGVTGTQCISGQMPVPHKGAAFAARPTHLVDDAMLRVACSTVNPKWWLEDSHYPTTN